MYLAAPHDVDTVRLFRNLGLAAPSPSSFYYDWAGGKPFDSQVTTVDMCTIHRRAYVLSEMGVGKTRAVLYAYDYLRQSGQVRKLLVVAPLSTLTTVWENEVFENFPHLKIQVVYGDKKKRLKQLAIPADIYVINHEGVGVVAAELWNRTDIDTIIIDELASYRNHRSARWKTLEPLVKRSSYAWGLTGSPTPNEPSDAYGQSRLLTPQLAGPSHKFFKDSVMRQVGTFKWIPRDNHKETIFAALQPAVRFTRDECFDLPPTTYGTRQIQLSAEGQAAYRKMFQDLSIQVRGNQITAANEGVKLSKLLQIAAGFAYDDTGVGRYIGGIDRFKEIVDLIDNSTGKVIVFAPFRYFVELLGGVLGKRYQVGVIHGDVSKSDRDRLFAAFQHDPLGPRVLVAHPRTMAHGLTLTSANTVIWASPTTSNEIYEQANARITRSGQSQNTFIIHVTGTKAEERVFARLKKKGSMQGALLELFEN